MNELFGMRGADGRPSFDSADNILELATTDLLLIKCKTAIEELLIDIEHYRATKEALEERTSGLEEELGSAIRRLAEAVAREEQLRSETSNLNVMVASLKARLGTREVEDARLAEALAANEALRAEIEHLRAEISKREGIVNEWNGTMAAVERRQRELEAENSTLRSEVSRLKETERSLIEETARARGEAIAAKGVREDVTRLEAIAGEQATLVASYEQVIAQLRADFSDAQQRIVELSNENQALNEAARERSGRDDRRAAAVLEKISSLEALLAQKDAELERQEEALREFSARDESLLSELEAQRAASRILESKWREATERINSLSNELAAGRDERNESALALKRSLDDLNERLKAERKRRIAAETVNMEIEENARKVESTLKKEIERLLDELYRAKTTTKVSPSKPEFAGHHRTSSDIGVVRPSQERGPRVSVESRPSASKEEFLTKFKTVINRLEGKLMAISGENRPKESRSIADLAKSVQIYPDSYKL
eukprot:TRINITY_DN6541_c0_g1_i4.p1 TRINITY_DN6541_c0_g1~~TRINITY_DN6541_c0_g1_i4.p1  ORF type:complete len:492 (+),score=113.68 TRINITY_DN6541_c0_g1_i4:772-2247(+)